MPNEQEAKLYLTNAVVKEIKESQYGWRVKATVERDTRAGDHIVRWFTLWFRERPEHVDVGWVISASGYFKVKGSVNNAGGVSVSVEMNVPVLQSAVPGGAVADPWSSPAEGWE